MTHLGAKSRLMPLRGRRQPLQYTMCHGDDVTVKGLNKIRLTLARVLMYSYRSLFAGVLASLALILDVVRQNIVPVFIVLDDD